MIKRSRTTVSRPAGAAEPGQIDTLIGVHTKLSGELNFEGTVRIDGIFEGNIRATKDGMLIVSESAEIRGEVHVPRLQLHGLIKGNVHAADSIEIGPKGRLNGDLEYRTIQLAEGGAINGRCTRIDDTAKAAQAAETAKAAAAGKAPQAA
ncbi:MAG: polymer-forming cytoskeletal protein [Mariprofundaceae bacterium]